MCGTTDGSLPSKDNQQIFFKDKDNIVKTIETNTAIIGCYPTKPETDVPKPRTLIPDLTKCAEKNQTYCTKNDDYPIEYVNFLLQKHKRMFAYAFGSDSIVNKNNDKFDIDVRTNRIPRQIDGIYLCASEEKIIYPTSGKTIDGSVHYIFNTKDHLQGVSVSECTEVGESCEFTTTNTNYIETECQQHFVYRELLSISLDGVPVKLKFELPSYCNCGINTLIGQMY